MIFFKAAFHANPGGRENEQDQAYVSQNTSFDSLQIYQLTIMYRFDIKLMIIYKVSYFKIFLNIFCIGVSASITSSMFRW